MKAIKKIMVAVLLSLSMVVSFVPMNVFAAEAVDIWDGTADTSWYVGHEVDSEYHITTAEQLAGLAQLVNGNILFKDKTIYLDNDLDLSGHQWISIGNGSNFSQYFGGTFDGQYHKIMNLYHHYTGEDLTRNGLFGVISSGGIVKNLMVTNADIVSNDCSLLAGILADWVNGGIVENCYTSGKIENDVGNKMLGGLIGQCTWSTQVKGCASNATVISTEPSEDSVDTVGGLIGQWENSESSSQIIDCWFGGSVSCQNIYSAVGGILGANFDFKKENPGVIIKNCMVATKNINCAEPGNITWIAAVVVANITNCIWPDRALDDPDNNYNAIVKLVVDEDAGTASADPNFDQSICGRESSNFSSANVLTDLRNNASTGIEWVVGINHPTFIWDKLNILADYTKVDEAIANAKKIDANLYSNYSIVEDAINAVDHAKSKQEQVTVDSYADAINKAISELKYKDADYTKVNEAKAKVPSDLSVYTDETVKALKDALALVEEGKNITEQTTVDGYADAINKAIEGLVKKNKDYKVIEGEGGTFVKESGKDISIRIDHEYTENVKVEVDDQEVDKVHYKVTKGSTIITFDDMYLNTLAVGTHHVKVTFEDGIATTTLVIKEQTKDDNKKNDSTSNNQETVKPVVKAENKQEVKKVKTGDDENIIGIALLLLGSLVVLTYIRKKKID